MGVIEPDIITNFSTTFNWYLGTDGQFTPNTFDFVTVVLHELGHGLGFVGTGSVLDNGEGIYGFPSGRQSIYDVFVEDGNGTPIGNIAAPNVSSVAMGDYLTNNNLFLNAPSVQVILGKAGKIYAPSNFNPGSSYSHWDEATFPGGDLNSLMTPFYDGPNHNIGDITRGLFEDHGWMLAQDCDPPVDEPCRITGITVDPLFPDPTCDDPGVFSEEGGVFGPVGSHVICFQIEGITPENLPLDDSRFIVKISGEEYAIIDRGFDVLNGDQYFYLCVGGVTTTGNGLDVSVELEPGCSLAVKDVYDAPVCGEGGGPCEATAGTLRAGNTPGCLNGHEVFLKARENMAPHVPAGYAKLYVLTRGGDLVIQKTSHQPVFGVREPGTLYYSYAGISTGND